jgi:hypothetical protein
VVNPRPQENRGIGPSAAVCVAHRNRPTPQWPQHCGCVTQKQPHPAWHGQAAMSLSLRIFSQRTKAWCHSVATPQFGGVATSVGPNGVKGARSRWPWALLASGSIGLALWASKPSAGRPRNACAWQAGVRSDYGARAYNTWCYYDTAYSRCGAHGSRLSFLISR